MCWIIIILCLHTTPLSFTGVDINSGIYDLCCFGGGGGGEGKAGVAIEGGRNGRKVRWEEVGQREGEVEKMGGGRMDEGWEGGGGGERRK